MGPRASPPIWSPAPVRWVTALIVPNSLICVLSGGQGPNSGTHGCSLTDCAGMSDSAPGLHMLNVVEGDMAASLDFYHRLGIAVPGGEVAAGGHVQLRMPGGLADGPARREVAEQTPVIVTIPVPGLHGMAGLARC